MSAEYTGDFNLVENPWVRVQFLNGEIKDLSLREVFELSPQIRRLAHDNALIDTSVLAVLEAIFMRAIVLSFEDLDELPDTSRWLKKMMGAPEANLQLIFDYLDQPKIKNRFNLFDEEAPFMQVAGLTVSSGDSKDVSERLIFDSKYDYFSMRAGKKKNSLSKAESAQYLISCHAYAYAGMLPKGIGDTRKANPNGCIPPMGTGWFGNTGKVILHGDSLWETFLLNLPIKEVFSEDDEAPEDLPVWEHEPDTAAPRNLEMTIPTGPCDVLTWQSRRVLLILSEDGIVQRVIIANGDKISDRFIDGANRFDPWTGYRFSKNQSSKTEKVFMPLHHSSDATVWRGAEALVILRDNSEYANYKPETVSQMGRYFKDKKVIVQLVGAVYGKNNSIFETAIDESLTMELALISNEKHSVQDVVLESIRKSMDAAEAVGQYAGNLLVAAGKKYESRGSAKESLLNKLETAFRIWLANVSTSQDAEELSKKWQLQAQNIIWQEVETLAQGAGQKAITGRIDENGRLINTATAQFTVRKKLKELFPYAYSSHEKEDAS